MSESFTGEIRMFAGDFAPRAWSFCNGDVVSSSQNAALSNLLGTTYGGDGTTTFGLPDCRGRMPIHSGSGPGLSPYNLGDKGGAENGTLTVNQLPVHDHGGEIQAVTTSADSDLPSGKMFATSVGGSVYHTGTGRGQGPISMDATVLSDTGGNQTHTNIAPSVCVNFIISLFGIYPTQ